MQRIIPTAGLMLFLALPANAVDITLNDGTHLQGSLVRMAAATYLMQTGWSTDNTALPALCSLIQYCNEAILQILHIYCILL